MLNPISGLGGGALDNLPMLRTHASKRISSYDRTGANADYVPIRPGTCTVIADIEGPGCIKQGAFP